ncbi:hypothetical protein BDW60DRAFT_219515 [Aspergillus nidulans var. acristatus]
MPAFSGSLEGPKDIPNLSGKVILITGGTAGPGAAAAIHLAKHSPAHIYISGRNAKSADAVIQQAQKSGTKVSFLACNLASLNSVKKAAETIPTILAQESRLDLLMCNAGIMAVPPGKTDGYEIRFRTIHLGHALLIQTCLLQEQQTAALPGADVRVAILTSLGFRMHQDTGIVFSDLKSEQNFTEPSLTVHPGVVGMELVENLGWASRAFVYVTNMGKLMKPEEGTYNKLWASTTPK